MSRERCGRAAALVALLGLAGCLGDTTVDRGVAPPILLRSSSLTVTAPEGYGTPDRAEIGAAVASLGAREPDSLDARVTATSRADMFRLRSELIGLGIDPARIVLASGAPASVTLTATAAAEGDCHAALDPNAVGDVSQGVGALGDCVAANDLVQGLVDPRDLVRPLPLAPYDAPPVVRAVRLYRAGKVAQPTSQPSAASEDGSTQTLAPLIAGSPSASGDASAAPDDSAAAAPPATDTAPGGAAAPAPSPAPAAPPGAVSGGANPLTSPAPLGGAAAP